MTKINAWVCDICKDVYRKDDAGFGANAGFKIVIPSGGMYDGETTYEFEDTCINCRVKLQMVIERAIGQRT